MSTFSTSLCDPDLQKLLNDLESSSEEILFQIGALEVPQPLTQDAALQKSEAFVQTFQSSSEANGLGRSYPAPILDISTSASETIITFPLSQISRSTSTETLTNLFKSVPISNILTYYWQKYEQTCLSHASVFFKMLSLMKNGALIVLKSLIRILESSEE